MSTLPNRRATRLDLPAEAAALQLIGEADA